MKSEVKTPRPVFALVLILLALVMAIVSVSFGLRRSGNTETISAAPTNTVSVPTPATNGIVANTGSPATATTPAAPPSNHLPVPRFSWFQVHPFPASQTNGAYEWTAADGKDTNVIRQLAHNELEYQRMVAENPAIYRRQLVYHTDAFTLQAQQAVQAGQKIEQIILPGLDGQEFQVAVTKTDFESGGDRGLFYGKLQDDPNSMVTAAFINGREAFTVVSSQDQVYLQGESREPGEIVVKSIDPKTYGGTSD